MVGCRGSLPLASTRYHAQTLGVFLGGMLPLFPFRPSRAWGGLLPGSWQPLRACPTLNLVAPEPLRHSLPPFQGTVSSINAFATTLSQKGGLIMPITITRLNDRREKSNLPRGDVILVPCRCQGGSPDLPSTAVYWYGRSTFIEICGWRAGQEES